MEFNPTEEWRTIESFPLYQVSNRGRIKRLEHIMVQSRTRHGYLQVSLYDGHGNVKHCRVNRLVAIAFLADENTNLSFDVHHIDKNKQNNDVTNLMFISHWANCMESVKRRIVCQYDMQGMLLNKYPTIRSAATAIGCSPPTIAYHCKTKNHLYKGYMWRFDEDNNKYIN